MSIDPRSASADELLQALTVGDLAADDARVAGRFAQDPALRARWQAIAATLAELQLLDSGMRSDVPGSAPAPAATLPERTGSGATRARSVANRWWLLPTLLAAGLGVMWALGERPPAPPDPKLGPGERPGALQPEDGAPWPADSPLRWSPVRAAAGYRLEVQPLPDGAILWVPEGAAGGEMLPSPSWLPTPAQRASLPRTFRWRVIPIERGPEGRELAPSDWATTSR
jgi:hypothetical protein